MCGIIGYVGKNQAKDIILHGLKTLEYRGYDSSGIAILSSHNNIQIMKSEGKIMDLTRLIEKNHATPLDGVLGIGHTRWATHGPATIVNAHPHRYKDTVLVHNGIIENYLELKSKYDIDDRELVSETDSEIIAHIIEKKLETLPIDEAFTSTLKELEGSYALCMVHKNEKNLWGASHRAPLILGFNPQEKEIFFSSDVQALYGRCSSVIYLPEKTWAKAYADGSYKIFNFDGVALSIPEQSLSLGKINVGKNGFKHYMAKEIFEQPACLKETISNYVDGDSLCLGLKNMPKNFSRIYMVASGTARHAALIGQYYMTTLAQKEVVVDFGSEFRDRSPKIDEQTLIILISQSGETADTLRASDFAKKKGATILAICNTEHSTMVRKSDYSLLTLAGPEVSVASTKAYTTQILTLYLLALEFAMSDKIISTETLRTLLADLKTLPALVDEACELDGSIRALLPRHSHAKFFFFLGRGILYPVALEGALKLKEISYLPTEGLPSGEIKHGPIALIDPTTSIIVLIGQNHPPFFKTPSDEKKEDSIFHKMLGTIQEIRARKGNILILSNAPSSKIKKEHLFADDSQKNTSSLYIPDHHLSPLSSWAFSPILFSVPLQLLSYHMALHHGTDIDQPRNLAKCVTVE